MSYKKTENVDIMNKTLKIWSMVKKSPRKNSLAVKNNCNILEKLKKI